MTGRPAGLGLARAWALAGLLGAATLQMPALGAEDGASRSSRHALIIAVGRYADTDIPTLPGIEHDLNSARQMARALGVPETQITVLRDEQASAARIRAELQALPARIQDGDRVFLYHAGHGTRVASAGAATAACEEALLSADGQALPHAELADLLLPLALRADKVLMFVDAAYAGGVEGSPFRTRALRVGDEQLTPRFSPHGAPEACSQAGALRSRSLVATASPEGAGNLVVVAGSGPNDAGYDSSRSGGLATGAWRDCLLADARDLDGNGAVSVDELTRCAQVKLDWVLGAHGGFRKPRLSVAGNAAYAPSGPTARAPAQASAPRVATLAAPEQVLADIHAQRHAGRTVALTTPLPELRIGQDSLRLALRSSHDGWLYLLQAGSDGQSLTLLFPNAVATANRVRAGLALSLPDPDWELVAGEPPGTVTLLAVVTDAPRDLTRWGRQPDSPFVQITPDLAGRLRLQTVLVGGTPAAGCGRDPAPSCSDAYGAAMLRLQARP